MEHLIRKWSIFLLLVLCALSFSACADEEEGRHRKPIPTAPPNTATPTPTVYLTPTPTLTTFLTPTPVISVDTEWENRRQEVWDIERRICIGSFENYFLAVIERDGRVKTFTERMFSEGEPLFMEKIRETVAEASKSWEHVEALAVDGTMPIGISREGKILFPWDELEQLREGDEAMRIYLDNSGISQEDYPLRQLRRKLEKYETVRQMYSNLFESYKNQISYEIDLVLPRDMWTQAFDEEHNVIDCAGDFRLLDNGKVISVAEQDINKYAEWENVVQITMWNGKLVALTVDGAVKVNSAVTAGIDSWESIKYLTSSLSNLVGLKDDGTVVVALGGAGGAAWLTDAETWKDIEAIVAGDSVIVGIDKNGKIKATGCGDERWEKYLQNQQVNW